ncbi:hypothetical protein [Saccharothrix sp. Mg75]|uniref:hypothetical protein n=1 Tax=Saccharothrix sp. Mg75 TaxID=3445357 RepID=UPI003EEA1CB6
MTRRGTAVVALCAGALLTVLGSLFPLYGVMNRFTAAGGLGPDQEPVMYAWTAWEPVLGPTSEVSAGEGGFRIPVYGYAFVVAAALVALGAVLQLRRPLSAAIGRVVAVLGLGLLLGTLWAALETTSKLFGTADGAGDASGSGPVDPEFVGSGTWLIAVAAAAVLAGVVLAHDWPSNAAVAGDPTAGPLDDDVDTPPFGIPLPVIEVRPVNRDEVDDRRHPTGGNSSTVEL